MYRLVGCGDTVIMCVRLFNFVVTRTYMKRTTYSAYGILFAVSCAASACSSADTSGPGGGTGGFDNGAFGGGSSGFGNGGSNPFGGSGPGNGGTGPGNGGTGPGNGGAGPGNGGVGPGNGGVGPGNGGVGPGNGGVGPGSGGAGPTGNKPPCMKNPSQVVQIGDSYMNWGTHTFPADLNAAAGVTFRPTNAIGGYSMGSGGIGLIPPEFDTALAADPNIIAVVMDGGGNDVLIPSIGRPDCKNMANAGTVPGCQAIVTDALAAADKLMTKMVASGVHDAIYFFYPHVPEPTALGGSNPNAMLDYALPIVKAFCDGVNAKVGGKANCWFLDTVPIFAGHSDWFAAGDIHENSTGSKAITQGIVDLMKAHCIAQPASSGCCAP
jgi:hypothetical protein